MGDVIKYEKIKGVIVGISKNDALIESEGLKLHIGLNLLRKSTPAPKPKTKTQISLTRPTNLALSLDLHGFRSDEALERLDKFISGALIAGLDEVLVYRGIGTGKLAFVVKEFLKSHKSAKNFSDASINQGGLGTKLVRL